MLTITNMYPPHHLGGYELSCRDVMARLAERGHRVTVLTSDIRRPGVVDDRADADVRRELAIYWDDHALTRPPLRRRLAMERANQRALLAAIDAARPDVVSVWNMGAMSLGLLTTIAARGIPMVLAVCNDWLVFGERLDAWTRSVRKAGPLAGWAGAPVGPRDPTVGDVAVCFVSHAVQAESEAHVGHAVDRATVVYSGIDRRDFPPVAAADDRPWRGQLLFAGRLDPRKGVATVLRAMARLADVELDVVGPGSAAERSAIERLAAPRGGGRGLLYAEAERPAWAARYRPPDAVVFPSEWAEPFGLVPVEAMACGTPVIASGTGGSAEFLVDGENALLAPPGDVDAWAAAIARLGRDASLRRRLVTGGFATAAELDVERLTDCFEAWHHAAAAHFADGVPPDRPPIVRSVPVTGTP